MRVQDGSLTLWGVGRLVPWRGLLSIATMEPRDLRRADDKRNAVCVQALSQSYSIARR